MKLQDVLHFQPFYALSFIILMAKRDPAIATRQQQQQMRKHGKNKRASTIPSALANVCNVAPEITFRRFFF